MRLLIDTQLLLWAAAEPHRISETASELIGDSRNELHFSVVSLWEITIKNGIGRPEFQVDTRRLRRLSLQSGYRELAIEGEHALLALPPFHKDPFDRLLVAQAAVEALILLTADAALSQYASQAAIRVV